MGAVPQRPQRLVWTPSPPLSSLPEFMDFILFGKTILVVNKKFGLFLANQLRKRGSSSVLFRVGAAFLRLPFLVPKFWWRFFQPQGFDACNSILGAPQRTGAEAKRPPALQGDDILPFS